MGVTIGKDSDTWEMGWKYVPQLNEWVTHNKMSHILEKNDSHLRKP